MTRKELESMVSDFDEMIKTNLDESIDLFCDKLAKEGGPAFYETAENFRRRGWKTAANYAVSKVNK